MKKIIRTVFFLVFICLAFGCKKGALEKSLPAEIEKKSEASGLTDEKIDLDLASLSSTMIFAEIFNMVVEPEKYEGKKIRMKGVVSVFRDGEREKSSYACIVKDAAACCAQGFDFVLSAAAAPGGYPEDGDEITLTGTFTELVEDGISHYMIAEAEWR